jgi:signal transduction histidine kinase
VLIGVAIGLLIIPIRNRARRFADRLVYGKRATPYEILEEFSSRMSEAYAAEDVLPRMARILGEAVGADRAHVWLRIGDELRPAGRWPDTAPMPASVRMVNAEPPPLAGDLAVPVRHHGELLGALEVAMPSNDPINPERERLVHGLAAQAGLVLRNARLIEELRASRERLVAAQDQERRKIERNIHDGAQQQLVALAVQQRLATSLIGKDDNAARRMLEQLQTQTNEALEDLRDLARGIYPPLLADKGLPAAFEAQARKAALPVAIEPDGIGRYPQQIESAVYFSVLEALQNIAKYARATRATVRLSHDQERLMFEVADDGRGFDAARTGYGTGLQGIADRLAALGGSLEVVSAPGDGTTVAGRVPIAGGSSA